jgi:hypothetical protein
MKRRWSGPGVFLFAVSGALVLGLTLSVTSDRGARSPALAGRTLVGCSSLSCPEADRVIIEAPYDMPIEASGLDLRFSIERVTALPPVTPSPCKSEVRRDGAQLRTALTEGNWRVVLRSRDNLFGALLHSIGDTRPPDARAVWSVTRESAALQLVSDRGSALDITPSIWSIDGDREHVEVRGGALLWSPAGLGVDPSAMLGPVCRGLSPGVTLTRVARPSRLVGVVHLPDRELTATVALP